MEWPEPWGQIDDATTAAAFEAELQRELSPGHTLFGLPLRAVGRRWDCDDVLFAVEDGSGRVAAVHLTCRQGAEPPPWPNSGLYESRAAWAEDAQAEWERSGRA
jgi:hypothetical protein